MMASLLVRTVEGKLASGLLQLPKEGLYSTLGTVISFTPRQSCHISLLVPDHNTELAREVWNSLSWACLLDPGPITFLREHFLGFGLSLAACLCM